MGYLFKNQHGVLTVQDEATVGEPRQIRFIDPHYNELFKISDGEQILISYPDGTRKNHICRYMDDYHVFVGHRAYHICEFAETMERLGAHIVPYPEKRTVWSNIDLNLKDWIDDLREEFPDYSEDEYYAEMVERNDGYFDDERANLNIPVDEDIVILADIGRWNGRFKGYKVLDSGNLSFCLSSDCDMCEWYVDREGEFRSRHVHHDGTDFLCYRKFKAGLSEDDKEEFLDKVYCGKATQEDIDRVTEKLGIMVGQVYGWEFPTEQKVRVSERQSR